MKKKRLLKTDIKIQKAVRTLNQRLRRAEQRGFSGSEQLYYNQLRDEKGQLHPRFKTSDYKNLTTKEKRDVLKDLEKRVKKGAYTQKRISEQAEKMSEALYKNTVKDVTYTDSKGNIKPLGRNRLFKQKYKKAVDLGLYENKNISPSDILNYFIDYTIGGGEVDGSLNDFYAYVDRQEAEIKRARKTGNINLR
jgi:hypothetical protein